MVQSIAPERLRELRVRRGWTQQDLSDRIAKTAWVVSRRHVGINADMVAKWERGVKAPSPSYRDLIRTVFAPDEVWSEWANARSGATVVERRRQVAAGVDVEEAEQLAHLLEVLEPASEMLRETMYGAWREEAVRRRSFLRAVSLAPVIVPQVSRRPAVPANSDRLTELDQLARRYEQLYHSSPAKLLRAPIAAHLSVVDSCLAAHPKSDIRYRLLCNKSAVALLAGRIAYFDMGDTLTARSYLQVSVESAHQAGRSRQVAVGLGHAAFLPAEDGSLQPALDYLDAGRHALRGEPDPAVTSWLWAVESEILANYGETTNSLRAIEYARQTPIDKLVSAPFWFDYFDAPRLDGFEAYAHLRARRSEDARAILSRALDGLGSNARKQRSVFLCDLATVQVRAGELEDACEQAEAATREALANGYAATKGRLLAFRQEVEPWERSPYVRSLDECLAKIA